MWPKLFIPFMFANFKREICVISQLLAKTIYWNYISHHATYDPDQIIYTTTS